MTDSEGKLHLIEKRSRGTGRWPRKDTRWGRIRGRRKCQILPGERFPISAIGIVGKPDRPEEQNSRRSCSTTAFRAVRGGAWIGRRFASLPREPRHQRSHEVEGSGPNEFHKSLRV